HDAERATVATNTPPDLQEPALRDLAARFQPEFARLGAAGDEAAGAMADRLQRAVAPEVKAPPPRPAPPSRAATEVAVDGGTPAEQARILALWDYASRRYPRIAATVPEIEIIPAGQGMGGSVNLLDGGISLPADATLADLMHEITHSAQRLKMSRTLSEEPAVRRELAYRGVPESDLLPPPRAGEAGFLRFGRKAPPPPADPFDAVMPPVAPEVEKTGAERLQAVADRVTDEMLNQEDSPVRRLRRAGQPEAAKRLEDLFAR